MNLIEQQELQKKIMQLESQNELMKKLSTSKGFYEYYFELLKASKTKVQAFNKVNKLYSELFGLKRHSNFSVFSKMVKL